MSMRILSTYFAMSGLMYGAYCHPAAASPDDALWSVSRVTATIERSRPTQTTVTLTAVRASGPLVITATPISRLIQVSPTNIPALQPGEKATINLNFAVPPGPAASLKEFSGAINVESRGVAVAPTLPFRLTVGQSNELVGTDDNNNDVWDYIDSYINANITNARERAAAVQLAKSIQEFIVSEADKERVLTALTKIDRGVECYYSTRNNNAYDAVENLKGAVLNNDIRSRAYIRAGELIAGAVRSAAFDNVASCSQ